MPPRSSTTTRRQAEEEQPAAAPADVPTAEATPDVEPEPEAEAPIFTAWPEDKLMDPTISTRSRLAVASRILEGVSKAKHEPSDGERGVKYAYRGIEDVATAVRRAFGQVGLFITVTEQRIEETEVMRNSKPWVRLIMGCTFTIESPASAGNPEDAVTGFHFGEGLDNADKVHQKALTGAYKDFLVKTLCIATDGNLEPEHSQPDDRSREDMRGGPTSNDDPWKDRPALDDNGNELVQRETWQSILSLNQRLTADQRKELTAWRNEVGIVVKVNELTEDDALRVIRKIGEVAALSDQPEGTTGGQEQGQEAPAAEPGPDAAPATSEPQEGTEGEADPERPFTDGDDATAEADAPAGE